MQYTKPGTNSYIFSPSHIYRCKGAVQEVLDQGYEIVGFAPPREGQLHIAIDGGGRYSASIGVDPVCRNCQRSFEHDPRFLLKKVTAAKSDWWE